MALLQSEEIISVRPGRQYWMTVKSGTITVQEYGESGWLDIVGAVEISSPDSIEINITTSTVKRIPIGGDAEYEWNLKLV